jgi:hypothetical protein
MSDTDARLFAHHVYFTLKDSSPAACQQLVEACRYYLDNHPGTRFFAAGTLADAARDVNDRDFHVALAIVFESRQAHDQYQAAPRHQEFVERQRPNWARVRVFDADVVQ